MKGFPVKTPLKPFVSVRFEDGEEIAPENHIKNFSIEIGTGKVELELYDADGLISQEVIKTTNDTGGRFASGKRFFVSWGWIEQGRKISSREHKVFVKKVSTRWEPATGFVFTLDGAAMVSTEKRNLKGAYSGTPKEAIRALMNEAAGDKNAEKVQITYLSNNSEVDGDEFFQNSGVTAEGENKDWEKILRKILSKCTATSGEKINYHKDSFENKLIISDHSSNTKNINEDYYDGAAFEFGRLPGGQASYLTEFEVDLDNTILQLAGGINSEKITSEMTSEEEGDVDNEAVGVSGDQNIGKTEDANGSGVEGQEGKLASEASDVPDTPEARSTIDLNESSPSPDDLDLEGRDPADVTASTTQQVQRAFNRLGSQITATFIGNPLWDDIAYIGGCTINFDVYSANPGKAGQSFNKILSLRAEATMVTHSIQGGQYFCTFPELTTQQTS